MSLINVSVSEIDSFSNSIDSLISEIGLRQSAMNDAYWSYADKLEKLISAGERSLNAIDNDMIVCRQMYELNRADIAKRQAAADAQASQNGITASKVDDSVLGRIDKMEATLRNTRSRVLNTLGNYRSALNTLRGDFETLSSVYANVEEALNGIGTKAFYARRYVEEAADYLAAAGGEEGGYYGDAKIIVNNLRSLSSAAEELGRYANELSRSSGSVDGAVERFRSELDDDVSRYSESITKEISSDMASLAQVYKKSAASIAAACGVLSSYLRVTV